MDDAAQIDAILSRKVPIRRNMFQRLKIGRMLILAAILPLLPLSLLSYHFLRSVDDGVDLAARELRDARYDQLLAQLSIRLADHAALSTVRPATATQRTQLARLRAEIAAQAAELDRDAVPSGQPTPAQRRWSQIRAALADLESLETLAPRTARDRQLQLLAAIAQLRSAAAARHQLAPDATADTYYMLDAAMRQVPELALAVGRMRADLGVALAERHAHGDERRALGATMQQVRELAATLASEVAAVGAASAAGKAAADAMADHVAALDRSIDAALSQLEHDVPADAPALVSSAVAMQRTAGISAELDAVHAALQGAAARLLATHAAVLQQQRWTVTAVVLAGVALSITLTLLMLRIVRLSIASDIAMRQVVQAALDGDLTRRADWQAKSVFAEQVRGINALLDKMQAVINAAHGSATAVVTGMNDLTRANADLGARTESAACSLEATAASMEEMTATVAQNAANARQAHELAAAARRQAEQGGAVVTEAVGAMNAISESSKKIAEIVGVIDEIAFQTNLLSLNAAVEAARAGEQGRGFAVVASEVRGLANRSAIAAREIKALILDSVAKVRQGANLVETSGVRLGEIVRSVQRVSDVLAEIAAASGEQSAGISQVNAAVMQLEQTTQGNAGFVERSTSMAEDLRRRCADLLETLGYYVRGSAAAPAASRALPAPPDARPAAQPGNSQQAA